VRVDEAREMLKIPPGASISEIRLAYRRLAFDTHPDRGGDTEIFLVVGEAYRLLIEDALGAPSGSPERPRSDEGPRQHDVHIGLGTRFSVVALSLDGVVIPGAHRATITLSGLRVVIHVDLEDPCKTSGGEIEIVLMIVGTDGFPGTESVHYRAKVCERCYDRSGKLIAFGFQPM